MMEKISGISVLYIEDEETVRQSVARTLGMVIENVAIAENGMEALEYLRTHPVDLIITDIRMPQMDGLAFVEKLREEEIMVPVVITSAFKEVEYFQKAIDLKIDTFINKPIRIADLIEVVTRLSESIIAKRDLLLRQQELEHYRQAINETSYVLRIDAEGNLVDINASLRTFLDTHPASPPLPAPTLASFMQKDEILTMLGWVKSLKIYTKAVVFEYASHTYTMHVTAFASILKNEIVQEITVMFHDLTPILREKEEIIHRLYTDELTGLPNRQKLFSDLGGIGSKQAILIIDIERFSNINYLYGYDVGDEVLKQTANLLQHAWPGGLPKTLYRADIDHFVFLIDAFENDERGKLEEIARKIAREIEKHDYTIENLMSLDVGVTIGASCDGLSDLYSEASMALAIAKENHKPFMCFADITGIKQRFETNLSMQRKIKMALDSDKILTYYQAIMDPEGNLVKYEALIRMEDPDQPGNILTPYHFLDIARRSKNYPLLTRQVIASAFRDFGEGPYGVSINLTFDDIVNPEITEFLEEQLQNYPAADLTLELLESEGLMDIDKTIEFCYRMKRYGAKIAIDDFGSGYSNFVYFFDIPIDILKIDGSIVRRVHDYRGYLAVETIANFARLLGVQTVAEFVEDASVFEKLKTIGIDMYQGYYFARPEPLSRLNSNTFRLESD